MTRANKIISHQTEKHARNSNEGGLGRPIIIKLNQNTRIRNKKQPREDNSKQNKGAQEIFLRIFKPNFFKMGPDDLS